MKVLKYKDFVSFINEAREKKPKKDPKSGVPDEMYVQAEKFNKVDEFNKFISLLPADAFKNIDLFFSKILLHPKEFFTNLYSLKTIKDIKVADYTHGLGSEIFMSEPKGIGRGELLVAWLIEDAQISGGKESFDVQYKNEKFEVKDYSKDNGPIRLGTKGKITRFGFWREIVDTTRRLDKLSGKSSGNAKFDFGKYFDENFSRVANQVLDLQSKWLGGEMGKEDFGILQEFYDLANTLENKVDKDLITNVILRGPDAKPKEISIEPIHTKDTEGQTITVTKTAEDSSYTYIITELRRLKYVRDPKALMTDIEDTITKDIVGNVPFFIFRPDGPHIETDFKFYSISQNGVKIIESRLADKVK